MSTGIAGTLEDLRRDTAGDLKDLRRNWDSAYEITGAPIWHAVRRDNRVTLIASSPLRLRDLITADYAARPVPRSCPDTSPAPAASLPALHPLMLPGEVGDVFGVSDRTVTRWEQDGTLECLRLPSGVRRYFRAQVDALLRDRPLTREQMRAMREDLAALAKGRPSRAVARFHPWGCRSPGRLVLR